MCEAHTNPARSATVEPNAIAESTDVAADFPWSTASDLYVTFGLLAKV